MSDESTTNSVYPSKLDLETRSLTDRERQRENVRAGKPPGASRTVLSAALSRLALRLGKKPDELAKGIPDDTLRRLKYPFVEIDNDDNSVTFKEPPPVIEGYRGTRQ